jgi:mannose-6-phosphate isomerase-like protein (cupin superfamily)
MSKVRVIDDGRGREFHGQDLAGSGFSLIWVEAQPGDGPRLHRHTYEEMFVVEGNVTFIADGETIPAKAGNVVVVPAGVPHAFINAGPGVLRQIDIHGTDRILTEWLDEDPGP